MNTAVKKLFDFFSQLNHWPVAVSLSLSFVSAVTILGIPAEIYIFGSMYCW